ncbi:MAG TPA: iron-sulfur cluster repair di-iron protein [Saprospiraceae bacterium]|nr:iron-sulfur cluster repair di-iron protein [Saprospiraceae bacterium]
MEFIYEKKVGEVVAEDYRAAAVFQKYGIDFCCKGNITVDEACARQNLMTEDVMRELKILYASDENHPADYQSWNPAFLADFIVETHHRYVQEKTPVILGYLAKLSQKHGGHHPELLQINKLFSDSANELASHMQKEEQILFPRIRNLAYMHADGAQDHLTSSILNAPIQIMMHEHDNEGERFKKIDILTDHYQAPADACNTYKVTYALLQEFENDLHLHIHLENNILFPKAVQMEKELMN